MIHVIRFALTFTLYVKLRIVRFNYSRDISNIQNHYSILAAIFEEKEAKSQVHRKLQIYRKEQRMVICASL